MQTQIFNASELNSSLPLREDPARTNQWLQQLLQDEEIQDVGTFREHGLHMLRGPAVIRGQALTLIFEHKGSSARYQISALRVDGPIPPDAVRLLRFVIRRNGRALTPGLRAHRPAFTGQPERLGIRTRRSAAGRGGAGTSAAPEDLFGHAGERQFVEAVRARFPELDVDWVNEQGESGRPYDVLIGQRLAVDVKATRTERPYAELSRAEQAFRDQHPAHHAIALVTLQDDPLLAPLSVDLYHGPQLRRVPFARLPDLLTGLPNLVEGEVPDQGDQGENPTPGPERRLVPPTAPYFRPGRYECSRGGEAWVFEAAGGCVHGGQRGSYGLQAHALHVNFASPAMEPRAFHLQVTDSAWTLTDNQGASWVQVKVQPDQDVHAPDAADAVREDADNDQ